MTAARFAILLLLCAACVSNTYVTVSPQQSDSGDFTTDTDAAPVVDAGAPDSPPWVLCTVLWDKDAAPVQFGCGSGHVVEPDGGGGFNIQLGGVDTQGNPVAYGQCSNTFAAMPMRCGPPDASWCSVRTTDDAGNLLGEGRSGPCVQQGL